MTRILRAALCAALVVGVAAVAAYLHPEALPAIGGGAAFAIASFGAVDTYVNQPAILVGNGAVVSRQITLISGENRKRGTVLGKISIGAASSAAKAGGNTGTGTLTMDATTPIRPGAKTGVYSVRFTAAATNNGTFRVEDPDGNVLGDVVMAGGAGAFDDDIKFAIADGGTDFVVGDGFDITVAAGSGKYKMAATAAVDGSAAPAVILAEDTDASGGDKVTVAYFVATVDENALTYGTGHSAATCREPLRDIGINLQSSIA